jgi:trans-aconitate methyltransferase
MSQPHDWNPADYDKNARFVSDYGNAVVDLLLDRLGGSFQGLTGIDLGCGDGVLTLQLQQLGADILGLDASPSMVGKARALGVRAEVADGHHFSVPSPVDFVFSNATLHWLRRPDEVLTSVAKALKPGGVFVAEFGGLGNVAAIMTAIHAELSRAGLPSAERCPWYFPAPDIYRKRLQSAGFTVEETWHFPRPTPLPTGMRGWLETFAVPYLSDQPREVQTELLDNITALLAPALRDEEGKWIADYVRLRFVAVRR